MRLVLLLHQLDPALAVSGVSAKYEAANYFQASLLVQQFMATKPLADIIN